MNKHLPIEQDMEICQKCSLNGNRHVRTPCLIGTYSKPKLHEVNKQCDVMIVVESPEREDEAITDSGHLKDEITVYNTKAGSILRTSLEKIDVDDYYITYIVKCRCASPRGDSNQQPTPKIVKSCNSYFQKEIELVDPRYVLLLGNMAMKGAIGKSGLGDNHGIPFSVDGRAYLSTYNVSGLYRNAKYRAPYKDDINIFQRIIKSGGDLDTLKEKTDYYLVDTMDRVKQLFTEIVTSKFMVFDLETVSVNPWKKTPYFEDDPAVVCIAISTKTHVSWVLPLEHPESPFTPEQKVVIRKLLKAVMEDSSIKKAAHNAKFDTKYLWVVEDIKVKGLISDTMLVSYILNENRRHGLKPLALGFTDMGDYEGPLERLRKEMVKKGPNKGGVPKSEEYNYKHYPLADVFKYASGDSDATIRLHYLFEPMLEEEGLTDLRDNLIMKMNETLERIEYNGAKLNVPYAKEKTIEYEQKKKDQEAYMRSYPEIVYLEEYYRLRFAAHSIITYKKKYAEAKEKLMEFCQKTFKLSVEDFLAKIDSKPIKDRLVLLKSLRIFEDLLTEDQINEIKAKESFKFNSNFNLQNLIYDYLGEKVFKKTESKQPAVDEEVIITYAPKHDILNEILKYKKLSKFLSTYIKPSTEAWLCDDGYIHTLYSIHGTVTGRLSSKQPNMQNLPRDDKVVKSMIISRFGSGKILNVDYCIAEDERIASVKGLIPIKYIEVNDNVSGDNSDTNTVSRVSDQMEKECVCIETVLGYQLKATDMHKLRVIDSNGDYVWRRIKDIQINDYVAIQTGVGLPEKTAITFPDIVFDHANNDRSIKVPLQPNEMFMEFLGYMHGDGNINNTNMGWLVTKDDYDLFEYLFNNFTLLFGKQPTNVTEYRGVLQTTVSSKPLEKWLYTIGWSKGDHLPYFIWKCDKKLVGAYLRGLFESDGHADKDNPRVSFSSQYESLVHEVQLLLLSLGIPSKVRSQDVILKGKKYKGWSLQTHSQSLPLFVKTIGFISNRKKNISKYHVLGTTSGRFIYPNLQNKLMSMNLQGKCRKLVNNVRTNTLNRNITLRLAKQLKEECPDVYNVLPLQRFVEHGQIYDTVKLITPIGKCKVRDIQVPASETFIASGFVTHNSQLELRVLAVYSMDKGLIEAYRSGKDLHQSTASIILKKPFEEVTKDERQIFKSINFLVVYGGTAMALAAKVDIDESEAQKFMDSYFKMFPGVTRYMADFQDFAVKNKYVCCLTGRKRRLMDVDSDKDYVREEALRMAINSPIQSTASDITQISLYNLQKVFDKVGIKSLLIGTVHDSAFIDLYPGELQKVCTIIETVFENPTFDFLKKDGEYIIPFKCDIELGENYGNLEPVMKEGGVWSIKSEK